MSTRHARVADKELNDKHTRILIDLLRKTENKTCADCKKKDPRWASWNLGIFVCIRCSGVHRSLGTHISKVKSVDLDTWTVEQIENMINWGNERANNVWEANLNGRQLAEHNMDGWIRAKYEQRLWAEKEDIFSLTESTVNTVEMTVPVKVNEVRTSFTDKEEITPIKIKEEVIITPAVKDLTKEFGLLYHNSINNKLDEKKEAIKSIVPPVTKVLDNQQQFTSTSTYKKPEPSVTTTSSGFKIDMSAFQQQLSGLSLGRPSSGLIPQAPPGSNTSWTNFIVNQDTSKAVER